jgi:hypothetical protein
VQAGDIPPACNKLVALKAPVAFCAAVYPKSFWKDEKVSTPPITPVSYAKRNDPMQQRATR